MKKIVLFFAFFVFTVSGYSQGLEFIGQDEITYGDPSITDLPSYFIVKNNSDQTRTIKVRRNAIDLVEGTSHWFCWVLCWGDDIDESPFGITLEPGQETNEFSGHFNPNGEVYGDWAIEYCFFDQNDPEFEFCTTVFWSTEDPLSVEEIYKVNLGNPQPNPAIDVVRIPLAYEALPDDAFFTVHSIVGEEVKNFRVPVGTNLIEFDTNDLAPGVYIYSLRDQNIPLGTGRLVVQ